MALEALVHGFAIDGHATEERHFLTGLRLPDDAHAVFLSKRPSDIRFAPYLLRREREMFFLFMLRDPRDVVVSRHGMHPDRYWTHLAAWRRTVAIAHDVRDHENFILLRYEDLVREPETTQDYLMKRMPFLVPTAPLREFPRSARPSHQSVEALGGVRPIDTASIGKWREHKPRLAAQMQRHGSIAAELIEFGYERDDTWLAELAGVEPDNGRTYRTEFPSWWRRLQRRYVHERQLMRYRRLRRPNNSARSSFTKG